MAKAREILIDLVDEFLASRQSEIDRTLFEARIRLGECLGQFTDDELAIGINQAIGYYHRSLEQDQGRLIEQLIDNALACESC